MVRSARPLNARVREACQGAKNYEVFNTSYRNGVINMCGTKDENSACPFACTERSEQAQNYGCLPSPFEIVTMRTKHGKTWACHEEPHKPCVGAINHLKKEGLPYNVIDTALLTEQSDWGKYVDEDD